MTANHHVIRATVIGDITAERRRQIEDEGWSSEHDDEHTPRRGRKNRVGPMAEAAVCYVWGSTGTLDLNWPWDMNWWKPTDYRRDLVKAAALLVAEIERLDRAVANGETPTPGPAIDQDGGEG